MRIYAIPALLIGILTFIGFRIAYIRSSNVAVRVGLILAGLVLAIPAVLFTSNYMLLIPYADWFFNAHTLPGVEASSGLVGALLGIMFASSKLRPSKLNFPVLSFCTILASGLLIAPFAKQLLYGVDYSNLTNKWNNGICLQTSSYTCVPACVSTLIRMQGGNIAEPELARAAGTTKHGTETWYLARALKKRGYKAHFHNVRSLRNAPVPSVVSVNLGDIRHVVVLLAKDENGLTIGEPLRGRHSYKWSVFQKSYHPDGMCITITAR
ncbi:hypothetical protein LLG39_09825 [bacterium]|nr:hypothetical protein [bacterium]